MDGSEIIQLYLNLNRARELERKRERERIPIYRTITQNHCANPKQRAPRKPSVPNSNEDSDQCGCS